jgi:hypothetical protein
MATGDSTRTAVHATEDGYLKLIIHVRASESSWTLVPQDDKGNAIAKFDCNDPQYRDRDLLVFCFDRKDTNSPPTERRLVEVLFWS